MGSDLVQRLAKWIEEKYPMRGTFTGELLREAEVRIRELESNSIMLPAELLEAMHVHTDDSRPAIFFRFSPRLSKWVASFIDFPNHEQEVGLGDTPTEAIANAWSKVKEATNAD